MKTVLKQALWWASPALFKRITKPSRGQTFSIGIFSGRSPVGLTNPEHVTNPVMTREHVTDAPAAFVADPFMVRHEHLWYMFFEVLNSVTRLGQISVATSSCGFKWTYAGCVLKQPFHLAYPHVFQHNGNFYMVPDTPDQGVIVYRASAFPLGWKRMDTLLDGGRFSDSSIFRFNGGWWMLTAWSRAPSDSKSLRLFFADDPLGPWHEHPAEPHRRRKQESIAARRPRCRAGGPHAALRPGGLPRLRQPCARVRDRRSHSIHLSGARGSTQADRYCKVAASAGTQTACIMLTHTNSPTVPGLRV